MYIYWIGQDRCGHLAVFSVDEHAAVPFVEHSQEKVTKMIDWNDENCAISPFHFFEECSKINPIHYKMDDIYNKKDANWEDIEQKSDKDQSKAFNCLVLLFYSIDHLMEFDSDAIYYNTDYGPVILIYRDGDIPFIGQYYVYFGPKYDIYKIKAGSDQGLIKKFWTKDELNSLLTEHYLHFWRFGFYFYDEESFSDYNNYYSGYNILDKVGIEAYDRQYTIPDELMNSIIFAHFDSICFNETENLYPGLYFDSLSYLDKDWKSIKKSDIWSAPDCSTRLYTFEKIRNSNIEELCRDGKGNSEDLEIFLAVDSDSQVAVFARKANHLIPSMKCAWPKKITAKEDFRDDKNSKKVNWHEIFDTISQIRKKAKDTYAVKHWLEKEFWPEVPSYIGLYFYYFCYNLAMPFVRCSIPDDPLRVNLLKNGIIEGIQLHPMPNVRFNESLYIQPVEHISCESQSLCWIDNKFQQVYDFKTGQTLEDIDKEIVSMHAKTFSKILIDNIGVTNK